MVFHFYFFPLSLFLAFCFFYTLVLGYGPLLIVQIFHLEFLIDLYFVGFRQSKYHKEVVTFIRMFINQSVNLIASYFVARFSLGQINIKKACPLKWEIIIHAVRFDYYRTLFARSSLCIHIHLCVNVLLLFLWIKNTFLYSCSCFFFFYPRFF